MKMEEQDPAARPKYAERIKYLVLYGNEKSKIKDLVVNVEDFMENYNHNLNALYYIKR